MKSGITKGTAIFAADLDNNGGPDLIVAGADKSEVYLSDPQGKFAPPAIPVPLAVTSIADLSDDGLLDLTGVGAGGKSDPHPGIRQQKVQLAELHALPEQGGRKRTRRRPLTRSVSAARRKFGQGCSMESSRLRSRRFILASANIPKVDVTRIIWPTGNAQSEFDLGKGTIRAEQRLGGSCPFLYTWDGSKMTFLSPTVSGVRRSA